MEELSKMNDASVGVFDSGLGGLTVVRELIRELPDENIVYFGDTARVPYGCKSRETVTHYTRQILNFLMTKNVKAIVVACNTASAYALETVRKEVPVPIVGVIKPGARVAVKNTKNRRIGVIGTEGTVRSGTYAEYIHETDPQVLVYQKPCPLFVPLVEEGMWNDPLTTEMARRYTGILKEENVDTLIMGCTHYPLLRNTLAEVMGEHVTLINPAHETALELRRILEERNMLRSINAPASKAPYRFYVSDGSERFRDFASMVLRFEIPDPELIDIESYEG